MMADGVARMRKVFFDRRAVIDRIGRAKAAVLSKAGAFIRRSATGTNAGKWWKDSDQTWDSSETANAMTHQADGQ